MKRILYVSVAAAIMLYACKKDSRHLPPNVLNDAPPNYLSVVKKYIHQHPGLSAYDSIDFKQYKISKQKTHWYLRLPLKNKSPFSDCIIMQTDSLGNTSDAKLIHLEQLASVPDKKVGGFHYNGLITIHAADGQNIIASKIADGYIEALHPNLFQPGKTTGPDADSREESLPYPYDDLPEVIVVAYLPSSNEGSSYGYANFMSFVHLFDSGGGGSAGGGANSNGENVPVYSYGGSYNGSYGGGGAAAGQSPLTSNQLQQDPPDMIPAFDESFSRPQIDMDAWTKCFANITDAGASFNVTLLGDLPDEGEPGAGINIWNGNTGHCFLQLTKTNGGQSVTQIIGFTAQSPFKALINTEAFVPAKTVDNAGHKYDCSITMPLTAVGFNTVIDKMKSLSSMMPYSVVNYDCLDYALDVFNSVRDVNPLKIHKVFSVDDPFSNIANGPKLYGLLQSMVESGSPESGNIVLGGPRHAGVSHGPCN